MSAQEARRRSSDGAGSLDISQMIADENDPKQRAFLIVLHSINQSLEANTDTVREINSKLENHLQAFGVHVSNEEQILNQGRGAWKVFAWIVAVVQVLATYSWVQQRGDMQELGKTLQATLITDATMKNRIDQIEKALEIHRHPGNAQK